MWGQREDRLEWYRVVAIGLSTDRVSPAMEVGLRSQRPCAFLIVRVLPIRNDVGAVAVLLQAFASGFPDRDSILTIASSVGPEEERPEEEEAALVP